MAAKYGPREGNPRPETTHASAAHSLACLDCPGAHLAHDPACPYAADLDKATRADLAFFEAHPAAVLRRRPASWSEVSFFRKQGVPGRIRNLTVRRIDTNTVCKLLSDRRGAMVSRFVEG